MCNEITRTRQEQTGVALGRHPNGMEKAGMVERLWEERPVNPPKEDHRAKSQKPISRSPPLAKTHGPRSNPAETRRCG